MYLLVKHKVADFTKWYQVFESHAKSHREAGLHLLYLLHDTNDPNHIVYLFRVDDVNKARAFTQTPDASEAGEISGVIGEPEMMFLEG